MVVTNGNIWYFYKKKTSIDYLSKIHAICLFSQLCHTVALLHFSNPTRSEHENIETREITVNMSGLKEKLDAKALAFFHLVSFEVDQSVLVMVLLVSLAVVLVICLTSFQFLLSTNVPQNHQNSRGNCPLWQPMCTCKLLVEQLCVSSPEFDRKKMRHFGNTLLKRRMRGQSTHGRCRLHYRAIVNKSSMWKNGCGWESRKCLLLRSQDQDIAGWHLG